MFNFRVKDMMKRSFAEMDSAKNESQHVVLLKELENKLESTSELNECSKCLESIHEYYWKCSQINEVNGSLQVSRYM